MSNPRDVEIENLEKYRLWIGEPPNRWDLRISALLRFVVEAGGIWRKMDYKWKRKMQNE